MCSRILITRTHRWKPKQKQILMDHLTRAIWMFMRLNILAFSLPMTIQQRLCAIESCAHEEIFAYGWIKQLASAQCTSTLIDGLHRFGYDHVGIGCSPASSHSHTVTFCPPDKCRCGRWFHTSRQVVIACPWLYTVFTYIIDRNTYRVQCTHNMPGRIDLVSCECGWFNSLHVLDVRWTWSLSNQPALFVNNYQYVRMCVCLARWTLANSQLRVRVDVLVSDPNNSIASRARWKPLNYCQWNNNWRN